jgi:peroxiredoxin Q/BCP
MTHLQEGDKAPHFTGINQHEKEISLKDFDGKKLILFFYPKDNTPGCTAEACDLRDNYSYWKNQGYEILGISPDTVKSHQKFIEKFGFEYDLIADPEKEILKAYGTYGPKMMYGKETIGVYRTTFVIDESGTITRIFKKVKTKEHTAQIAKGLGLEK